MEGYEKNRQNDRVLQRKNTAKGKICFKRHTTHTEHNQLEENYWTVSFDDCHIFKHMSFWIVKTKLLNAGRLGSSGLQGLPDVRAMRLRQQSCRFSRKPLGKQGIEMVSLYLSKGVERVSVAIEHECEAYLMTVRRYSCLVRISWPLGGRESEGVRLRFFLCQALLRFHPDYGCHADG